MAVRKVQVVCPPYLTTGGPEALHQLVYAARSQGIDARIVYLPKKEGAPPPEPAEPYKIYNVEIDENLEDEPGVVVLVPELETRLLKGLKHAIKAIWWLSIDHYLDLIRQEKRKRIKHWLGLNETFRVDRPDLSVWHFAQSEYARKFLEGHGLKKVRLLTDFLRDDFFAAIEQSKLAPRRLRRVAFNPKKGLAQTEKIMALAGDAIEFVRLENMRPDQVRDALMTSSVYMDFGHHPGRDRIPREAAVCGCCVVTGRKGSAANDADVPIGSIYKIDESSADFAEQAVQILTKILDEPVKYSADFDDYRRIIEKQKETFFGEVLALANCSNS